MSTMIIFLSIFIAFFMLKYISTFLYQERYIKIIAIDSLLISLYWVVIWFLWTFMDNENDVIWGVLWGLSFFVIIPYIYAFIKPKILRKYFNWEVWMYYPITEFLVIILGYFITSVLSNWIMKLI